MANLLRLSVVPTKAFTIHVANGEKLRCQGRFEEELVDLQGTSFLNFLFSSSHMIGSSSRDLMTRAARYYGL